MKRIAILIALLPVSAQAADSQATAVRRQYEECVWTSLMTTPQHGIEPNYSAELSLAACQTEEQALGLYLASVFPGPSASAILVSLKLRLKREMVRTAKGLQ